MLKLPKKAAEARPPVRVTRLKDLRFLPTSSDPYSHDERRNGTI
jgi:hypothetical protein